MLAVSETSVFRSKSDFKRIHDLDLYQRLNIRNIFFITEKPAGKILDGDGQRIVPF